MPLAVPRVHVWQGERVWAVQAACISHVLDGKWCPAGLWGAASGLRSHTVSPSVLCAGFRGLFAELWFTKAGGDSGFPWRRNLL